MFKTIGLLAAGLAIGFTVAAFWIDSEPPRTARDMAAPDARRIADLELALHDEMERREALERRIDELDSALDALAARAAAPGVSASSASGPERSQTGGDTRAANDARNEPVPGTATPPIPRAARGRFATAEQRVEQLVNGGFTPQRAQWLLERTEQLRMQALQSMYEARREGRPIDQAGLMDEQSLLRKEIGDSEYEQYLAALGRPTAVGVGDVFASSPAETAGLRSGDQILSYGGTRVFDMRDLNRLTYEGRPGEPVVVEVLRDGQRMQLVLPRGPVGITAGRFGR